MIRPPLAPTSKCITFVDVGRADRLLDRSRGLL